MSKSVKASIRKLERITYLSEMLEETKRTLFSINKEGEVNDVIEKFDVCKKKLEAIQSKVENSEEENEIKILEERILMTEKNIKEDKKLISVKREITKRFEVTKEKWEIPIDSMMIIGKYFTTNNDFINVMKISKRYQKFTQIYHFNPISEWE